MNDIVERLLPCPWCGYELREVSVSEGSTFRWRKVDGCCTDGPEVRHDTMADDQAAAEAESRQRAIDAWNNRDPKPLAEIQRLRGAVIPAVPNDDSGLDAITRHGLFVFEVDFGDEGKGRYVRLNDFNKVVAKLEATQPIAAKWECQDCLNDGCFCLACNPYPPSAPAAVEVTEEMVERYLLAECQAINGEDSEYVASDRDREIVRAALTAALTKPGAGGEG
ncbi:MAG: hypothetical protein J7507_11880 [Pseudoxanthomonas sp.]|nr:hypothetical protein [Pseudoxanthomonas sp.]